MVKAIIDISKEANKALNIVKARHELKTKSEAIEELAKEYMQRHFPQDVVIAKREDPQQEFRRLFG